jgi:hypothetical protein
MKTKLLILLVLVNSLVFSDEINLPNYDFAYEINERQDIQIILDNIKARIGEYNYYYCKIQNAEESDKDLAIYVISKLPQNNFNGIGVNGINCILYYNNKWIQIIFSENEILGLTQAYTNEDRANVYNRIYNLIRNNMNIE